MMGPPRNSAAANCHPIKMTSTMPSSITRLVEANMNTRAEMKSAPLANRDLAMAVAAYEHDDDTMPKPLARATAAGPWSPRVRCICSWETKACTAPDRPKPNTRGHSVSQNMKKPSRTLRPTHTGAEAASRWLTSGPAGRWRPTPRPPSPPPRGHRRRWRHARSG